MKLDRLRIVVIATLWSWVFASALYLILTLPLEWAEWSDWVAVVNKILSSIAGHSLYAIFVGILGLFVEFRSYFVRLIASIACIALCILVFGVMGADNLREWLSVLPYWIAAGSMPFVFQAVYSRHIAKAAK